MSYKAKQIQMTAATFAACTILTNAKGETWNSRSLGNVESNGSRIARGWDPLKWDAPAVHKETDGSYSILRGHSRRFAVDYLIRNGLLSGSDKLEVRVYEGLSDTQKLSLMLDHGLQSGLTGAETADALIKAVVLTLTREDGTVIRGKDGVADLTMVSKVKEFMMEFFHLISTWGAPFHCVTLPHKPAPLGNGATLEEQNAYQRELVSEYSKYVTLVAKTKEDKAAAEATVEGLKRAKTLVEVFAICSAIHAKSWDDVATALESNKKGKFRVPRTIAELLATGADHLVRPYLDAQAGKAVKYNFAEIVAGKDNILACLKQDGAAWVAAGNSPDTFKVTPETAPKYFAFLTEKAGYLTGEDREIKIAEGKDPDAPDGPKVADKEKVRSKRVLEEALAKTVAELKTAENDGKVDLALVLSTKSAVLKWVLGQEDVL